MNYKTKYLTTHNQELTPKSGSPRKTAIPRQGRRPCEEVKYVRGFTLIEVLVSTALMVILAMGFLGLQYILSQNQVSAWRNYLSIEGANSAISTMAKELRDARPSESGGYPIEVANDQEIVFYSDIDYDDTVERVRYILSGNQLIKGIIKPVGQPVTYPPVNEVTKVVTDIVRNATTPVFYYYNGSWPTDTTNNPLTLANRISDTREVKIFLRTNPKSNMPTYDYSLESSVRIRMLR